MISQIKKKLSLLIGIFISISILVYLGISLDWSKVLKIMKKAEIVYLLLWVLVFVLGIFLRAYRWNFLFPADSRGKFFDLYDSLNIGNMSSMILPLRAGEFIRPFFFSKWSGTGFGRAFATVVIERVFDVCGMFLIFYFVIKGVSDIPDGVYEGGRALFIITMFIIAFMFVAYVLPKQVDSFIHKIADISSRFLPETLIHSIVKLFKEFLSGLSGIKTPFQFLILSVSTIVIWMSYVFCFQMIFYSLGGEGSFAIGAVTCVFVALFIAAPSAPAFLGVFQLGCYAALTVVFSYPKEFSIAYSIIGHSLQISATILIGLISMFFRGLSLSKIKSREN